MAAQIPYQVIVDVPSKEEMISEGLVIESSFANVLSQGCNRITLVGYYGNRYRVRISSLDDDDWLHLDGDGFIHFVNNDAELEFNKVCFTLIGNDEFQVQQYNQEGVEHRYGIPFSCLVEIDESTFHVQYLNPVFLQHLNGNEHRSPSRTVKIIGSNQDATVKLYRDRDLGGMAAGFEGRSWVNFVVENNFQNEYTMKLTKVHGVADVDFTVDVFTKEGVCVEYAREQVIEVVNGDHISNHSCRYVHDNHRNGVQYVFYVALADHTARPKGLLTVPTSFVRKYKIHKYKYAILHFGNLYYETRVIIMEDDRKVGDKSHVVLRMNWRKFVEETGVPIGGVIRFQLNRKRSIDGLFADFDVC